MSEISHALLPLWEVVRKERFTFNSICLIMLETTQVSSGFKLIIPGSNALLLGFFWSKYCFRSSVLRYYKWIHVIKICLTWTELQNSMSCGSG